MTSVFELLPIFCGLFTIELLAWTKLIIPSKSIDFASLVVPLYFLPFSTNMLRISCNWHSNDDFARFYWKNIQTTQSSTDQFLFDMLESQTDKK